MEAIGIIFFACLTFAIAILILITCCFFKVNGGKDSRDLEMFRPDTANRLQQMGYNKTRNENQLSSHSHNVILFLNKKDKCPSESKQNLTENNRKRINDDHDDEINKGNQNDGGQQNDIGYHNSDTCSQNSNPVQLPESTNYQPTHEVSSAQSQAGANNETDSSSNHINRIESIGAHTSHGTSGHSNGGFHNDDTGHNSHEFSHSNDGFSSHFSGSHHGDWGDHSGGNSNFGHNDDGDGAY